MAGLPSRSWDQRMVNSNFLASTLWVCRISTFAIRSHEHGFGSIPNSKVLGPLPAKPKSLSCCKFPTD